MAKGSYKQGSILGGSLLIAGCCIGAGMLGVPVLTAMAGFQPSVVMFIVAWLFMMTTGLLLLEANLWYDDDQNLISLAEKTLGPVGKAMTWILFLFLFYSLMIAYVAGSGVFVADFFFDAFGATIPAWLGALAFALVFAVFIYLGTRTVDQVNRVLMAGVIAFYLALISVGGGHVKGELLQRSDWGAALFVIPVMVISFGYHNLIPSLTRYLGRDFRRLRATVIIGSGIPLLVYLAWEWLILGIIPIDGANGFKEALDQGQMATQALRKTSGSQWVTQLAEGFSFFAIITSLLSVALSFVDFLADGLHIERQGRGKMLLCGLVLVPPFFLATTYPEIFLEALSYAGAFGAVVLFGVMPTLMVWKGRDHLHPGRQRCVPGGKSVLFVVLLVSAVVISLKLGQVLGILAK